MPNNNIQRFSCPCKKYEKKKKIEKGIIKTNKTTGEFFPMIIKSLNYDGTSVNPLESLSSRPSPRPYYIHRSPPEFPFFLSRQWRVKPGYKGTSPLYIYIYKTPRQTRAKGEPNSTFLFRRVSERKDTRYIARFSRNETAANKIQGKRKRFLAHCQPCMLPSYEESNAKIFYGTSTRNTDVR